VTPVPGVQVKVALEPASTLSGVGDMSVPWPIRATGKQQNKSKSMHIRQAIGRCMRTHHLLQIRIPIESESESYTLLNLGERLHD
jgi:hypothetical protein